MIIKDEIKNYLAGKHDGANGKEIAKYINDRWGMSIADVEVRNAIHQLRLEGKLIIAGGKGYLLTNDLTNIGKYLSSRGNELTREMKVLKEMARACNMIDQLTIWENNNENN